MKGISTEHKEAIISLVRNECTDSEIEDYCEYHNLDINPVFQFVADQAVPSCCKGCPNATKFPTMYPCTVCSRGKQDFYNRKIV